MYSRKDSRKKTLLWKLPAETIKCVQQDKVLGTSCHKIKKVVRAGHYWRTSKWYETLTFTKPEMETATSLTADCDLGITKPE
jgi:hypothetical protein